jgi:hypothetical protein
MDLEKRFSQVLDFKEETKHTGEVHHLLILKRNGSKEEEQFIQMARSSKLDILVLLMKGYDHVPKENSLIHAGSCRGVNIILSSIEFR